MSVKDRAKRVKRYVLSAREMFGYCPCFVCGEPVHLRQELDPTGSIEPNHQHPMQATFEHIVPISEGGNGHLTNMAVSHAHCNNHRHNAPKVKHVELPPSARRLFNSVRTKAADQRSVEKILRQTEKAIDSISD